MDILRTVVIYQNEVFGFAENCIYEFYEYRDNRWGSVPVSIINSTRLGEKICSCTTLVLTTSTTMGICDVRAPCAIFVPSFSFARDSPPLSPAHF